MNTSCRSSPTRSEHDRVTFRFFAAVAHRVKYSSHTPSAMSANIGWPDGLSWMMGSNVTIGSMPRLQLVVTADSGNSWEKFWKKSSEWEDLLGGDREGFDLRRGEGRLRCVEPEEPRRRASYLLDGRIRHADRAGARCVSARQLFAGDAVGVTVESGAADGVGLEGQLRLGLQREVLAPNRPHRDRRRGQLTGGRARRLRR